MHIESLVGEEGSLGLHGDGQVGEKRVRLGWKRRVHFFHISYILNMTNFDTESG